MSRLDTIEVRRVMTEFAEFVTEKAKSNLKRNKRNSSGQLARSIGYNLNVTDNSIELSFEGEDYLDFIDKGVSGTVKKYNTPFSFKSKGGKRGLKGMPPRS